VTVVNPLPWTNLLTDSRLRSLTKGLDRVLDGIDVHHAVMWHVPLVGRNRMWKAVLSAVRRALEGGAAGDYDAILATFAYPLGPAAMRLARQMGVPYVVKARGSDLHQLPASGSRRRRTAEALRGAAAVVPVSSNLARIAEDLGARPERIHVLPNGVDFERFPMLPRQEARARLGQHADGALALFVGNMVPVKGVDILLDAMAAGGSKRFRLAVAGDGKLRRKLERRVSRAGLDERVRFLGRISRQDVALWMNAADVVALPSRDEGCPNVVLEALACGTPVVASAVGAVPDLLDGCCGMTVAPGEAGDLGDALGVALERTWDRSAIRHRVEGMSWESNGRKLYELLEQVVTRTDNTDKARSAAQVGAAGREGE
jgi:glycosyltransferase involved in cell wall biosynthesis